MYFNSNLKGGASKRLVMTVKHACRDSTMLKSRPPTVFLPAQWTPLVRGKVTVSNVITCCVRL